MISRRFRRARSVIRCRGVAESVDRLIGHVRRFGSVARARSGLAGGLFAGGLEPALAAQSITPEDQFVILTRFDPDKPDQRERMLALVPRFVAWKLATAFVLTAEIWLGPERTRSGEEAVATLVNRIANDWA